MKRTALLLALTLLLASCSKKDNVTMDQAKAAFQAGNVAEAVTLYQKVIADSPDGPRTAEAMYRIAEVSLNIEKQPLKAAVMYEQIADKFPKSEFAHKGLYLAAFTYAEGLQNFDKARPLYERYLKDYPDSSMAKSAKTELANLGKSAEEVLQSIQQNQATAASQNENSKEPNVSNNKK